MNWISIEDAVRLIESALTDPLYSGAYNAVSPSSVTNREFTKTLGSLLHRPTLFRLPAALLRATLGEAANELMLATTKVVSSRLSDRGFVFLDDTIESCLRLQLGCPPASAREHLISDAKQPDQLP
jgi:NAD dependent epimerase/dehydratase family enzyme